MNRSTLLIVLCLVGGYFIHFAIEARGGVHKIMLRNIPLEDVDSLRKAYTESLDSLKAYTESFDSLFRPSDIAIVDENDDWGFCGNSSVWELPVVVELQITGKENFEALERKLGQTIITKQQANRYIDSVSKATGRYGNEVSSEFYSNKRKLSILSERIELREVYFREDYELLSGRHHVSKIFRYSNGSWALYERHEQH